MLNYSKDNQIKQANTRNSLPNNELFVALSGDDRNKHASVVNDTSSRNIFDYTNLKHENERLQILVKDMRSTLDELTLNESEDGKYNGHHRRCFSGDDTEENNFAGKQAMKRHIGEMDKENLQ